MLTPSLHGIAIRNSGYICLSCLQRRLLPTAQWRHRASSGSAAGVTESDESADSSKKRSKQQTANSDCKTDGHAQNGETTSKQQAKSNRDDEPKSPLQGSVFKDLGDLLFGKSAVRRKDSQTEAVLREPLKHDSNQGGNNEQQKSENATQKKAKPKRVKKPSLGKQEDRGTPHPPSDSKDTPIKGALEPTASDKREDGQTGTLPKTKTSNPRSNAARHKRTAKTGAVRKVKSKLTPRRVLTRTAKEVKTQEVEILELLETQSTVPKTARRRVPSSSKSRPADSHVIGWLRGGEAIEGADTDTLPAHSLRIQPVAVKDQRPVPSLSYGLDRVLFNPGVYHLQDPRSKVYNFDPYLQRLMPVSEFDFNALKKYVTSSEDPTLKSIAEAHGKKYTGSSSSMGSALTHFHFLLSQWRPPNTTMLSQGFRDPLRTFTALQRLPSAIFLRWQNGSYAIDADKQYDTANVLSMLGKSMEKLLTLPTEEFERYRRSSTDPVSQTERMTSESYHYCTLGDILMRSQLDAYDARLPGTGMFDLKTRAVIAIRMNVQNYQDGTGYQIKTLRGVWESFEREYFDMIRSAFLKYSLQVRMGRMDGIFVAYHNIERIFGFQYISLPEMDAAIHGTTETSIGDQEFRLSIALLNKVLNQATTKYPKQSLRIHFETMVAAPPFMYIHAEPMSNEEIDKIQSSNQTAVEEFEREMLGLGRSETNNEQSSEYGSPGALEAGHLNHHQDKEPPESHTQEAEAQGEVLTMVLGIHNLVNGQHVVRPVNLDKHQSWTVNYVLAQVSEKKQSWKLYKECQRRREAGLGKQEIDLENKFKKNLRDLSAQGKVWRKQQDDLNAAKGEVVLDRSSARGESSEVIS